MDKNQVYDSFLKKIIFWGRITLLLALVCSFFPAAYIYFVYGVVPTFADIAKVFTMISSAIVVSWIVEPIAYFPIVGITGTYMSWLAGNISNMRVPVSALSQAVAKVEEGTPEGDIISTIGIGMSVVVNLVILFLAVLFGQEVIAALPASVQASFKFILPAVFGAILANFALRDLVCGAFALVMAFTLSTLKVPYFITLPVCVFGTIILGIVKAKMKMKKEAK